MKANVVLIALVVLCCPALAAHHGEWYEAVFKALEDRDLSGIKDYFSEAAWSGEKAVKKGGEDEPEKADPDTKPENETEKKDEKEKSAPDKETGERLAERLKESAYATNLSENTEKRDSSGSRVVVTFLLVAADFETVDAWHIYAETKATRPPHDWKFVELTKSKVDWGNTPPVTSDMFREASRLAALFADEQEGELLPEKLAPYVRLARKTDKARVFIRSIRRWNENLKVELAVRRSVRRDGKAVDEYAYLDVDLSPVSSDEEGKEKDAEQSWEFADLRQGSDNGRFFDGIEKKQD